jgi:hypothetical protein
LTDGWQEVRYSPDPAREPASSWLDAILASGIAMWFFDCTWVFTALAIATLLIALLALAFGEWLVAAAVVSVAVLLAMPILLSQSLKVSRHGVRVRVGARIRRIDWGRVVFRVERHHVDGEAMVQLVISEPDRSVVYRGDRDFWLRDFDTPALADRLNAMATSIEEGTFGQPS